FQARFGRDPLPATQPAMETSAPGVSANGAVAAPKQQSSLTDVTDMWIKFAKTFAIIFPIYILGYLEFSFSWVLIGLAVLFYWRKNHINKDYRVNRMLAFLEHEEKAVKQSVSPTELPPWVDIFLISSPPLFSQTVKQMWPFICQFLDKLFRETIEPAVKGANPHLSTFCFTKIDMGDKPLRVNGVKVYTENVDKRQVIMDLQISFIGATEIDVDIKKYYCRAGIKSIQLDGVMRVVMDPLLGDMPLVGALSIFFLKKPMLDINWTGLTNMLDIPGVNGLCDSIIHDIISSQMVLPNSIKIPLVGASEMARLRFPMPKGVLRLHFIEAQDLLSKDTYMGGLIKGKSDPYGIIQVGNQLFKSKVIRENLNPKWNEVHEAPIYEHSGQNVEIELFDEDTDEDDFLGRGKLHLKLEWLSVLSTPEKLDQALTSIKADRDQASDGLSSALLVVFLDSARNLPVSQSGPTSQSSAAASGKKVSSDPSPYVQFRVGHKSFDSKTRYKTNGPVWEEAFTFLIHNPKVQELEVEVKDERHDCSLGTLTMPLSRLLEAEDMTLNQRFPLKSSGAGCTLKMKMALRVGGKPVDGDLLHGVGGRGGGGGGGGGGGKSLAETGRSTSNLTITGSQQYLAGGKEPTPSIASDISNPYAAQELQQRLQHLQNGSGPGHFPLGEIQLTVRHSSQRNKLIVVVHSCRNLLAFTDHGSDPYARLYLLPDKRRSGRRKTHTIKKNLNPVFDQTFEFSVSLVELNRRTLDVAVKNGGGLLSKHKGLLGKVLIDLTHEDITKGWTQWLVTHEDGLMKPHQL
uniref:Extended synaptotagmin-like protein 2a n=1 Tax=Anabas testudineus TaxID=64144 RepID=A0A7N6ARV1_ANATE